MTREGFEANSSPQTAAPIASAKVHTICARRSVVQWRTRGRLNPAALDLSIPVRRLFVQMALSLVIPHVPWTWLSVNGLIARYATALVAPTIRVDPALSFPWVRWRDAASDGRFNVRSEPSSGAQAIRRDEECGPCLSRCVT